jgi:hypothetical protein
MAKDTATETATGTDVDPWDDPANDHPVRPMPEPTVELVAMARSAIDGVLPDGAIGQGEIGDPEITARQIREEIRKAGSFDEAFGVQKLPAWQDIAGEPVRVHGFHLNPSTVNDRDNGGPAAYAVVQMTRLATGELEVRQCGGGNVLEQLVWAWEHKTFPMIVKLTSTSTKSGNTVLRLEKVEA